MKRLLAVLMMIIVIFSVSACSESRNTSVNKIKSSTEVNKIKDIQHDGYIDKEKADIVGQLDKFERATLLIKYAAKNKEVNMMVSPLSAEMLLQLSMNYMNEDCRSDYETYFSNNLEGINSYNKELIEDKRDSDELRIANSVWVRDKLINNINKETNDLVKDAYDTEVQQFNSSSVDTINRWVSDKTNGMIDKIIDEIDDDDISILLNAIYFKGEWEDVFDAEETKQEDFNLVNGDKVRVDMMHGETYSYYENKQATGFSKHYNGGYEFTAILPKDINTFDIAKFDVKEFLDTYKPDKYDYEVDIKIPKFESESDIPLNGIINELGLGKIFTGNSLSELFDDNTNITANASNIIQKTAIKMDEEGTEASAVTGMIVTNEAFVEQKPLKQERVYLDKPFYYIITDAEDNLIFIGYMANPT